MVFKLSVKSLEGLNCGDKCRDAGVRGMKGLIHEYSRPLEAACSMTER